MQGAKGRIGVVSVMKVIGIALGLLLVGALIGFFGRLLWPHPRSHSTKR